VGSLTQGSQGNGPTDPSDSQEDETTDPSDSQANPGGNQAGSSSASGTGEQLFNSAQTGNLPGNINNGGYLVEGDRETYVALKDGIYVLEPDGTIGRLVVSAKNIRSMNFYKEMLYYARDTSGLMCVNLKTGESSKLYDVSVGSIYIDNGVLYFENAEDHLNLYTIGFDGNGMRKISDYGSVYYRNIVDGYQYFANTKDDETLYRVNLETGKEEQLYDTRSAWISLYDSRIYFSDFSIPGCLLSMSLDGGPTEQLYYPSASYVNACPLGVFFVNADQKLELRSFDGNSSKTLVKEKCGSFCVSRDWIIYRNLDDDNSLWVICTDGTDKHRLS
jgi:hypothetical protein